MIIVMLQQVYPNITARSTRHNDSASEYTRIGLVNDEGTLPRIYGQRCAKMDF